MQAEWKVCAEADGPSGSQGSDHAPLKWANDAQTGAPRYIHDPEIVSKAAQAACPGCRSDLLTVLAGQPERIRPTAHFRHVTGMPRGTCVMAAARLAATHHLLSLGYIDLPKRRMSRWAKGFSGEGYEGWVELPPERARITGASLADRVTAELTLADGCTLLVDLTGEMRPGEDRRAIVTINLSDPRLAGMDIDQLRSRLRVLPPMSWRAHWRDNELAPQAMERAVGAARQALDAWTDEDEADFERRSTPECSEVEAQSLRRETLLHRTVKEILDEAKRINTPSLTVSLAKEAPRGYAGDGDSHQVELSWWTPPAELTFADVVVERGIGGIIPDIVGRLTQPPPRLDGVVTTTVIRGFDESNEDRADDYPAPWPDSILIEVAVTHRVNQAKLQRIEHLDLPALELDLGSLGGRLTMEGLRRLVVDGLEGKRWLHHPELRRGRQRLRTGLRLHPELLEYRRFASLAGRPKLLSTPVSEWLERYLTALTGYFDANARMDAIRKTEGPRHLEALDGDSAEWAKVALAAEALEAHGLPGGTDPELRQC